jgi:hypothetical protein
MVEIHCITGRIVRVEAESLEKANLDDMDLYRAVLSGANLRGAKLRRANLRNADLRGADLRGADLREADLSGAALMLAELSEARLNGAQMRSSRPIGADLRFADLRFSDLTGADIGLAHLEGAILKKACMRCERLEQAFLEGATYDQHTQWPDGFDPEHHGATRDQRSPVVLAAFTEAVYRYIKAHPGESVEQIARTLGTTASRTILSIRDLLDSGKIPARGVAISACYYPRGEEKAERPR